MTRLHLAPYLVSAASGRSVAACPPPVCAAGACVATARGPADPGSAVLSVKLNPSESILADAARPRFRQSPRGRPVRPTFLYILLHSITLYYTLLHSLPAERRLQGNIHFRESRLDLNDPPASRRGIPKPMMLLVQWVLYFRSTTTRMFSHSLFRRLVCCHVTRSPDPART